MQNLGQFYTTSGFDHDYLRNDSRYPKSESQLIETDSPHVRQNKSGELWSTIQKVWHVDLDQPKWTFSGDYISAPRGRWPLKFLHVLEIDKGMLTHTTNRIRGRPPKNFKGEHLKLGLKFHIWAPITLAVVGVTSQNFTRGCGSCPWWSSGH